jgi:hypothetical protein
MNTQPPITFTLERDAAGNLTFVDADGTRHEKAKPVRLFPLTEPDAWISVVDGSGSELACIEHIAQLPEDIRTTLLAALANRDFVPVIRSISSVVRAPNGHKWTVVTDRGPTVFQTESDESIQQLGSSRLVVIDHRNTRYLIPDVNTLDAKSRQRLERYY